MWSRDTHAARSSSPWRKTGGRRNQRRSSYIALQPPPTAAARSGQAPSAQAPSALDPAAAARHKLAPAVDGQESSPTRRSANR
jgi:hypothetical protein